MRDDTESPGSDGYGHVTTVVHMDRLQFFLRRLAKLSYKQEQ